MMMVLSQIKECVMWIVLLPIIIEILKMQEAVNQLVVLLLLNITLTRQPGNVFYIVLRILCFIMHMTLIKLAN